MPQKLVLNPSLPIRVERFLALSLPRKSADDKKLITTVLERVKAAHTQGQSAHTLSGGEWQRVLLARALLQSPDLLMLDEPVQGLDHAGQAEFYRLLRHISMEQGCAVVHVSHDLHLVWDASDHVVCLNKHICCQGVPEHVRSDPSVTRLLGGFAPYVHHHEHADGEVCTHPHSASVMVSSASTVEKSGAAPSLAVEEITNV
jgi:zinc transport system ATP-binding protein